MTRRARYGWESDLPDFTDTPAYEIRRRLEQIYVREASPEQVKAWADSIPPLQREFHEILAQEQRAAGYSTILEYELPMEARRPDVILLVSGGVLVLELKGKSQASQADIDQAAAYARDLRCYHRDCADRDVVPVLVPTLARGYLGCECGVHVAGADVVDELVIELSKNQTAHPVDVDRFLSEDAYRPLPTLVQAARELFQTRELRTIKRAAAATDPAVERIAAIIHDAAKTRTRRLVLVTGVPGSGKTLVGLRTVHAHFLDDLAIPREDGRPTAPAVFLSGNGPLVEVLQYELRGAGGGGKTFVRGVKEYVRRYSGRKGLIPPEHVLVFDEAQRAFDADQVAAKHGGTQGFTVGKSEPEHFIEFAERIPGWCVVIGLIGQGQEIHLGEEGGLIQWRQAVEGAANPSDWSVHAPLALEETLDGSPVPWILEPTFNLDTEIRYHLARDLHRYVASLLDASPADTNLQIAAELERAGHHLRLTRDLGRAKAYLRERYRENPIARFGLVASSKDRALAAFGILNDYQSTKQIRVGPWYSDPEEGYNSRSCRLLESCVTEFGAQGLELDATLLAWGTDLRTESGSWSNALARGYKRGAKVRDARQLRINAYRVLLTRGRDASVVFVPSVRDMDETYEYLRNSGFLELVK